jgi:hypothetical protein
MRSKTAFLVVPQGFAARFLLRTDVFETLKAAGVRIVVLTPNADEPYMSAEFAGANVRIEPLRAHAGLTRRSRLWSLLYHLRTFTLASSHETTGFQEKYARFRSTVGSERRFAATALHLALQLLWRSRLLRRLLLAAETLLYTPRLHRDLFERYRPDVLVTTSPGYFLADAVVLREARRFGVPTAAVILGWDNPTMKGYRGATPDRVVVWSERMAGQMVQFQDYPRERIFVGGVPHFDHYRREDALLPREELCRRLGLDRKRRIVLFAAGAPGVWRHNLLVAETLARAIGEGSLGEPAQLVVRLHPINFRPDHRTPLDEYERLREQHDHVTLDVPEILSERLRCDMPASDAVRLGSLMKHCDVLVNIFSTTTLEAFLLDRPVVLVGSGAPLAEAADPLEEEAAEPGLWHEYTHLRPVVEAGAARTAGSMPELVALVRAYLDRPELDHDRRLGVARAECGPTDGRAGARIGRYLLGLMGAESGESLEPARQAPAPDSARDSRGAASGVAAPEARPAP